MRGIENPMKSVVVAELKNGVPSSELSRKYGVAMSTITTWIKELPPGCKKSPYDYKNRRISVMRKVNVAEARITDAISDYIICGITDEEWEELQKTIQKELIGVATFDGGND